ncbi:hypothetical protein SDC9_137259 [bioreactor metagenome]|uniref:Uncharacterized protein n=1 Tax=bioreactor metagenome TaxID=1076179 RepID=A0A645DNN9_9ZZZZ
MCAIVITPLTYLRLSPYNEHRGGLTYAAQSFLPLFPLVPTLLAEPAMSSGTAGASGTAEAAGTAKAGIAEAGIAEAIQAGTQITQSCRSTISGSFSISPFRDLCSLLQIFCDFLGILSKINFAEVFLCRTSTRNSVPASNLFPSI